MNQVFRHPLPATTQAAEGLPRRRWTVAEIEELCRQGVFGGEDGPRERFELIGGQIVPMSAKGNRHEVVKMELQRYWFPLIASAGINLITETTLRYAPDSFLEPDFLFWPRAIPLEDIACDTALLLVEVADSSMAYDTGRKARIYAGLGLREYWVVNANTLVTGVHREPTDDGFASILDVPFDRPVRPTLVPELTVCLADIGLTRLQD